MKKIYFLVLALLTNQLNAQDSLGRIDETFLKAVVNIIKPTSKKDSNQTGTGFLITYTKGGIQDVALVTNKHMIGEWDLNRPFSPANRIIINLYGENESVVPIDILIKGNKNVHLHPNPKVDVAIVTLGSYFDYDSTKYPTRLHTNFLLSIDSFKTENIGFGSQVFAIGYPANIMIAGSNQAIAKSGYISSSINGKLRVNLTTPNLLGRQTTTSPEGKFYLVDGLIIGGNSGGPVVKPRDITVSFDKGVIKYKPPANSNRVLGIVSSIITNKEGNTGIAIIYSADTILEIMNRIPPKG